MGDAVADGRLPVLTAAGLVLMPMDMLSVDQAVALAALSLRVDALAGRLAALEAAQVAQARRDAAQDAALGQEATTRGAGDATAVGRLTALEARPTIVGFKATVTPGVLTVGTKVVSVQIPGVRAGDLLVVQPTAVLPSGVDPAWARPTGDGAADIAFQAVAAVTMASPIVLAVYALRV